MPIGTGISTNIMVLGKLDRWTDELQSEKLISTLLKAADDIGNKTALDTCQLG